MSTSSSRTLAGLARRYSNVAPLGVVLLAPLVGVAVLRAPLINHLAYRDPWFYSGYGWTLAHHIEIFGWNYYAVRFPVILPIRWSSELVGPVAGYVVLRYVILAATGLVLYVTVRRFASTVVACSAVALLAINPFYLRLVLWDYTSYVALPCAIMGTAIWFNASTAGRTGLPFLVSGALLGASVFANALSATVVFALFAVELIAAIRRGSRELARLVLRSVAATGGLVLIFVAGYLGYALQLGFFSPNDLIDPTVTFIRANKDSALGQLPIDTMLEGEPRIYAPVLLCVATIVALGRQLLDDTLRGRLAQFAVGYVALLWLLRLFTNGATVETWFAYDMAAISMCFAAPLILDSVSRPASRAGNAIIFGALAAACVATLTVRSAGQSPLQLYDLFRDNPPLLLTVLGAGMILALLLRLRRAPIQATVVATLFAFIAIVALTPARHIGISQTGEFMPDGRGELIGYRAAYDVAKLLEQTDQPQSRTLLWTPLVGLPIIGWINLPHQNGGIQNADVPPPTLSKIDSSEAALVHYPTTRELLLLSQDPVDMLRAMIALRRAGVRPILSRRGEWGDGHLYYALLELRPSR